MLLLLPPSEGKTPASGASGCAVDLSSLMFGAELQSARERMLATLVRASSVQPARALKTLKLSKSQADELELNKALESAPTAPARETYSGVLFRALGLTDMTPAQLKRADQCIVICSSLFGAVAPSDPIPAYRLSGDVTLPRLGKVSAYWRKHLSKALSARVADELVVDFRSSTYASFWRLPEHLGPRAVTVKVWQQGDSGQRTAVSHFNKEAKGKVIRTLTISSVVPRTPEELADIVAAAGWQPELTPTGPQLRLDITLPRLPQGSKSDL